MSASPLLTSSPFAVPPGVATALSTLGPLINIGMQGSSVSIALGINRNGSVGSLSPVPFIALLMNCFIWAQYGILVDSGVVAIPGLTGAVAGIMCAFIYDQNSKHVNKTSLYRIAFAILGVSTGLFMQNRPYELGLLGCFISVALMSSPLAAMGTVLREKSTASMPFAVSALTTLNVLIWLAYGLLVADDVMIYGPNIIGIVLCGIQMALYVRFGIGAQKQAPVPELAL